ncbi:N-acetyltransferase family protein [Tepidibacillus infernus]|uniref:GNAT family N-acetyltransferase n=1 Tax=Tepidibacillus infernus TaxID=1806172 RepID=UPI003B6B9CDD
MKVREMLITDYEDVIKLITENNPKLHETAREEIAELLLRKEAKLFVIDTGEEIVGVMGYRRDKWGVNDVYWAVWLYVHPRWHRKGVGTLLYKRIEQELSVIGCRKIYLDVGNEEEHKEAIAFHKSNGFVLEGKLKDFWQDGEDCLIYSKKLKKESELYKF